MRRILLIAVVCVLLVSTAAGAATVTGKHDERNRVGHVLGSETRRNREPIPTYFESRILDPEGTYTHNPQTNTYTLTVTGTLQWRWCYIDGCSPWQPVVRHDIYLREELGDLRASSMTTPPNGSFVFTVDLGSRTPSERTYYSLDFPGGTVPFDGHGASIPSCSVHVRPTFA